MSIFRSALQRNFTKPINIILMLVVPILLNLFLVKPNTVESDFTVIIMDEDNTQYTNILTDVLGESCTIKKDNDRKHIENQIINEKAVCAFTFEKGFTDTLLSGEKAMVSTLSINDSNVLTPVETLLKSEVNAAHMIANAVGHDEEKFYIAIDEFHQREYSADYKSFSEIDLNLVDNTVASMGFLAFSMLFLMSFSTSAILEDKKTGVYHRLGVSPVSRASYYVQNTLACIIISAVQSLLIINILPRFVELSYGSTRKSEMEIFLLCCVFGMVCVSIGMFICRIATNSLIADALMIVVNFPIIMLGGCLWPKEIMPEFLQRIGDFLPTSWFLRSAKEIIQGGSLSNVKMDVIYMIAVFVIIMLISFCIKTDKE